LIAKKILLVDDFSDTLKVTSLMLEGQGYHVVATASSAEALAKAETEKPDLILLDVMMPDLDGYEVCRRLRANPVTAELPILMFSSKGTPCDQEMGLRAGADGYLTKPVQLRELVARIETTLMRSRQTAIQDRLAKRSKIVGFLGSKGGVGTTTLAVNVAASLAQDLRGQRVLLADLQPGISALAFGLKLHPGGITSLLQQRVQDLRAEMVDARLQRHATGLRVLTGPTKPSGLAVALSRPHAEKIVRSLEGLSDYLLLDLGTELNEANRSILPLCHKIIVVIAPQPIALKLARGVLTELTRSLNLACQKISLVMLRQVSLESAAFTPNSIREMLQHDLISIIASSPDLAFQAAEHGVPMVTMQPNSVAAQHFRDVAEYVRQV
jgi:pilus assembly protein CpaE